MESEKDHDANGSIPQTGKPPAGQAYPVDPFNGLFDNGAPAIAKGSLLDNPAAGKWFRKISFGRSEGLYTYQQPLTDASGPYVTYCGRSFLMLSSYDYLGLISHPSVIDGAIRAIGQYGAGAGGVRLLTGTLKEHQKLEEALAHKIGTGSSMVFSSGYMANVAIITALLGPRDFVLIDERAHRSLVDGCRLARVRTQRFSHNDPDSLDWQLRRIRNPAKRLVAVDGIYSMDGDICPLPEILEVAKRNRANILIDEAHSFGVIGSRGSGITSHYGIPPSEIDLISGSLSKAVPSGGGFVAASKTMIAYLQHGASSFFFSGALPPASAGAALAAINVMDNEQGLFARLQNNTAQLRTGLVELGYDVGTSCTPIIPVITGSDERAYRLSRYLAEQSVIALAVVAPAVKEGSARLRLCATAALTKRDIDKALASFESAASSIN